VIGMVSNGFSIADPSDPGMLDVVGFDTATPNVVADFAAGSL
jgi:60 kDa SS-A/Ro ribonucleoprotein